MTAIRHADTAARVESLATLTTLATFRRPAGIPAPADNPINPINPARTALGKMLFFDPRLSGSGATACSTCHDPALGWEDGRTTSMGANGVPLARRSPTLLNIAWTEPLFWDGRADTLEEQAKGPLAAKLEMNMPHDRLVAAVLRVPGYRAAFAHAFPGEGVTIDTVVKAIAAFERTIVSGNAPFDRWVAGDGSALSASARRGFTIFTGPAACASCHSGWRLTDDGFHDIGLPGKDPGRAGIAPGIVQLEHAFKTPTLRNIAERAPYMHDGSLTSLDQVIDHYDHGFRPRPSLAPDVKRLRLTATDRADLIAFLKSLSSRDVVPPAPILPH